MKLESIRLLSGSRVLRSETFCFGKKLIAVVYADSPKRFPARRVALKRTIEADLCVKRTSNNNLVMGGGICTKQVAYLAGVGFYPQRPTTRDNAVPGEKDATGSDAFRDANILSTGVLAYVICGTPVDVLVLAG